jgi:hypothetical protein
MMKKVCLIILLLLNSGCKDNQTVKFCEGLDTGGEGVKCGSVFSAGDLMVLINVKEEFGADKLTVNIYEKKKFKNELFGNITINVKPEEKRAGTDIRLYKEGEYIVDVLGKDKSAIARGEVKIAETY